jgi:hypothetical protein
MAKIDQADFMRWCLATKTRPAAPNARAAYEKHLSSGADPSAPKVRAKMVRKHVAIFAYDGEGNVLGKVDAENTQNARLDAGFVLAETHGADRTKKIVAATVGGAGVLAVLPDGSIGYCFPIAETTDLSTGETVAEESAEEPSTEEASAS